MNIIEKVLLYIYLRPGMFSSNIILFNNFNQKVKANLPHIITEK